MSVKSICIGVVLLALATVYMSPKAKNTLDSSEARSGVYNIGADGKYNMVTNIEAMWPGIWRQNSNGWRLQVYLWGTNNADPWVSVAVGNTLRNSGVGYYWTPNGKFEKCALVDSNGIIITPKSGIQFEQQFPSNLPIKEFPRWQDGSLKNLIATKTNSPPRMLKEFRLRDVFNTTSDGEYTLTIGVSLYEVETNGQSCDKIELPYVSAKMYLKP
jgi:hypothetical protein